MYVYNQSNIFLFHSAGKTKRNGIVTNPAMRLVANMKNGLGPYYVHTHTIPCREWFIKLKNTIKLTLIYIFRFCRSKS